MHQAVVTEPSNELLRMQLRWDRPLFSVEDGLGEMGSLSVMDGLVLAFGFIDDSRANACGSGIMVAPGVIVTATHVTEETAGTSGMAYSFHSDGRMRLWAPDERHVLYGVIDSPQLFGEPRRRISDVCLVSCRLMSEQSKEHPLRMAQIEIAVPAVGERLWAVGYRETTHDDIPGMSMFCSSGIVTACHLNGRGDHLPGPCVEVAMNAVGGMSGGPVFNAEGHLVGIVSSSYEADDFLGPTFVSLIWPAVVGEVTARWPCGFWPSNYVSLKLARELGYAKVHGDVSIDENGVFSIRLPTADEKR